MRFYELFYKKCYGEISCEVHYNEELDLIRDISYQCLDRVRNDYNLTSEHYILVAACKKDWAYLPVPFFTINMNKHQTGMMIIVLDILSIFIMSLFLNKIKDINNESL